MSARESIIGLVALSTVALAACGPTELATPSAQQAERIIRDAFPDASVTVREVARDESTLRVPAALNEGDVVFVMAAGEEEWSITGIEQAGRTYTVEEIGQIQETMQIMRALSDALEAYLADEGQYPLLDDQVGLRELVPDYYPADGAMDDAWGVPLRYRLQGEDYNITSTGPDGAPGSPDDIILITGNFVSGV